MSGLVYKRPGSPFWYVSATRQSTKTVNRKEAEQFAKMVLSKVWRQKELGEYLTTWKELADDWLATKATKRTLDKDRLVIKNITEMLGGDDKPAIELTSEIISDYAAKLKPSTANRHLIVIRAMLRRAKKRKQIPEVPDVEMNSLPKNKGAVKWLTVEQYNQLQALLPPWVQDLVTVAVQTGLRASNVREMRWEWVKDGFVNVPAIATKTQEMYTVPLSPTALEVIERWKGKHPVYVFVRPDGVAPIPDIRAIWESARDKLGMPKLRFHDLRHTFASWHRQNGTPDHIIQEIGGWKSQAMLDNYAKVGAAHLTAFADNLNKKSVQEVCETQPNENISKV